ncbi:hypothetical protein C1645_820527 [Glomus cerebriforme]|uniref:Uncharacterized protein n=1 Tax=Glomus cerebriforme TaxID=658196 RepID=A0A397T8I1_9GLOM|nr:hypothetical protein C1645_820527 [Glomus cerebriforme]
MQSNVITQSMLHSVTLHLRKQLPFKENIYIIKGMTFSDLINFVFSAGPPKDKRFIFKLSFEAGGKQFLPEQIMHDIFYEEYANIWVDMEKIISDYNDLFD